MLLFTLKFGIDELATKSYNGGFVAEPESKHPIYIATSLWDYMFCHINFISFMKVPHVIVSCGEHEIFGGSVEDPYLNQISYSFSVIPSLSEWISL